MRDLVHFALVAFLALIVAMAFGAACSTTKDAVSTVTDVVTDPIGAVGEERRADDCAVITLTGEGMSGTISLPVCSEITIGEVLPTPTATPITIPTPQARAREVDTPTPVPTSTPSPEPAATPTLEPEPTPTTGVRVRATPTPTSTPRPGLEVTVVDGELIITWPEVPDAVVYDVYAAQFSAFEGQVDRDLSQRWATSPRSQAIALAQGADTWVVEVTARTADLLELGRFEARGRVE